MTNESSVAVPPDSLANAKAFLEMQHTRILGCTISHSETYGRVVLIRFDSEYEYDYAEAVRGLYPLKKEEAR